MTLDVLSHERISYPSVITEYPVESGSPVTDAIIPQSIKLSIEGHIMGGSVSIFAGFAGLVGNPQPLLGKAKLQDAKGAIERIYMQGAPVTIVTGLGIYPNMGMENCELEREGDGQGATLVIRAEFKSIRTVSTAYATVNANADPTVVKKTGSTKSSAGQVPGTSPSAQVQAQGNTLAETLKNKLTGAYHQVFGGG